MDKWELTGTRFSFGSSQHSFAGRSGKPSRRPSAHFRFSRLISRSKSDMYSMSCRLRYTVFLFRFELGLQCGGFTFVFQNRVLRQLQEAIEKLDPFLHSGRNLPLCTVFCQIKIS